jgi:hypothetical protein
MRISSPLAAIRVLSDIANYEDEIEFERSAAALQTASATPSANSQALILSAAGD